jgi:small subunit ribosomal protein S9
MLRAALRGGVGVRRRFIPPSQLHEISANPLRDRLAYLDRQTRKVNEEDSSENRESTLNEDDLDDDHSDSRDEDEGPSKLLSWQKTKPSSSSFYTTRPSFYDQMVHLEKANGTIRNTLKVMHLLPLPDFAEASLRSIKPSWRTSNDMAEAFGSAKLNSKKYQRAIQVLNEMFQYHRIALSAGHSDFAGKIYNVLSEFLSSNYHLQQEPDESAKAPTLDNWGRAYARGRRKTSSARVWVIPTIESGQKTLADVGLNAHGAKQPATAPSPTSAIISSSGRVVAEVFGSESNSESIDNLPISKIVVNNISLAEYFPRNIDRERVVRPLKVAGVMGKYNVFILARGGGTTGQSGAIAHGIARALTMHEPEMAQILHKGMALSFFFCYISSHPADSPPLETRSPYGGTQKDWPAKSTQEGTLF